MRRTFLIGAVIIASGCTANPILVAQNDYVSDVPDAISAVEDVLIAESSVARQRDLLNWHGSPQQIAGNMPLDLPALVCNPAGARQRFAMNEMRDYSSTLKGIGKAPKDGLIPALKAINKKSERLKKIRSGAADAAKRSFNAEVEECSKRINALYSVQAGVRMQGLTPALDAIVSIYDALTATAKMLEQETRAELVRAYVEANGVRMRQVLCTLVGAPNDSAACTDPKTNLGELKGSFRLQAYVDDHITFLMTIAATQTVFLRSLAVNDGRRLESAKTIADSIEEIRELLSIDADGDLLEPLVAVQLKFENTIEDPKVNLDDLMTSLGDLRGTRDKWVKARDDWRSARNGGTD